MLNLLEPVSIAVEFADRSETKLSAATFQAPQGRPPTYYAAARSAKSSPAYWRRVCRRAAKRMCFGLQKLPGLSDRGLTARESAPL
jgi:hypothetical protein